MAKNTLSLGSLVNLAELNKLVKKADTLIVGSDSGMTYICNGHWVVRLHIPIDSSVRPTIFSRLGEIPSDGTALRVVGKHEPTSYKLEDLKELFSGTFYHECRDTRMSEDFGSYEVRIFHCLESQCGGWCYIALNRDYHRMIADYARAASAKCVKSSPILFTCNYDEAALILPVNYDPSAYLSRV